MLRAATLGSPLAARGGARGGAALRAAPRHAGGSDARSAARRRPLPIVKACADAAQKASTGTPKPRRLSASIELVAGGPAPGGAGSDATCSAKLTASPELLAALRRLAPGLLSGDDLSPSVVSALAAAAAASEGGVAAAAPLAAAEVFSVDDATHVAYAGGIHPLLRDAHGTALILAPGWMEVPAGGLKGAGSRLLRLSPCSDAEGRVSQLKALGVVASEERNPRSAFGLYYALHFTDGHPLMHTSGARKHVVLTDGDLAPVYETGNTREQFIAAPPLAPSSKVPNRSKRDDIEHRKLKELRCKYLVVYLV
ncbi:MAG: hypothetical protein J3K34DRAFT_483627 [Monoraphidium minutum]|nr:MAG: hypothetical protein J3K34DRAFT_483627 [Monoraphidium minutum]